MKKSSAKAIGNTAVIALLIATLCSLSCIVTAEDYTATKGMMLDVKISGGSEVVSTEKDYVVQEVKTELTVFPRQYDGQIIQSRAIEPAPQTQGEMIVFKWLTPQERTLKFSVDSIVETKNAQKQVKKRIPWPTTVSDENLKKYLQATELIDSDNPKVRDMAYKLALGEDDLYILTHRVASFIRANVNYSLDTTTADVTQKASWVLENRYGVCDEITALFVAMMRSLGVPSRYVSGVAYTNYRSLNDWSSHAWAEVYFPDTGWVPFDIAYGQLGWIDNSHVKMKESVSPDEATTRYEWLGHSIKLNTRKLDFKVTKKESFEDEEPKVEYRAAPILQKVDIDSYNLIIADIENLKDYYVPVELTLSTPKEIETIKSPYYDILLMPKEKKTAVWAVKIAEGIDKGYSYDIPISVSTSGNATYETSFSIERGASIMDNESAARIIRAKAEEEKDPSKISLECEPEKPVMTSAEEALLICQLKNPTLGSINDISVCYEDSCRETDLLPGEEKSINFLIKGKAGTNILLTELKSPEGNKMHISKIDALDTPEISIDKMEYPNMVKYTDTFEIVFFLKKDSYSTPSQVKIQIRRGKEKPNEWLIDGLGEEKKFVLDFYGQDLHLGKNDMYVDVSWTDESGAKYNTSQSFNIQLEDVNFWQRTEIVFRDMQRWIEGLFQDWTMVI